MPSKTVKGSTAAVKPKGKGSQPRDDSEDELDVPPLKKPTPVAQEEAPPTTGK